MKIVQVSMLATLLSLSGWLHDGLEAFQAKKYPQAIEKLSQVCEKKIPENKFIDIALFYRAQAYKENGNTEKGLADLLVILKDYRDSPLTEKSRKRYLAWGGKLETLGPEKSPKQVWEQFMLAAAKGDMDDVLKVSTGMWKELVMKETKGRPDRLKREFMPDKLVAGKETIGKDRNAGTATLIVTAMNQPMTINFVLDKNENRWLIKGYEKPNFRHMHNNSISNINNLKQIGLALRMFSNVHNELFPKNITELKTEGFLENETIYLWTNAEDSKKIPFIYCPGFTEASSVESIIVAAPQPIDGKREVLFIDGHVETISEEKFLKVAKKQKWQAQGVFKIEDIPKATQEKVKNLIKKLANPKYEIRKQAKADLIEIGEDAFPILEQYRKDKDPEIKMTVKSILEGK